MAKWKASTLSVIVLVAVVLGALGYLLGALMTSGTIAKTENKNPAGPGTVYETPVALPDFTLTDQTGKPFTLSSARGKVVLMAFLYTHCGDVCPYSAIKMRLALEQLGDRARDVVLVSVSTDPERDTVGVIADYSRDLGLYDKWHMVTGPVGRMQQLYKDLKITVIKATEEEIQDSAKSASELGIKEPKKDVEEGPTTGLSDTQIAQGSRAIQKYSGGYEIAHAAPFWVLDGDGKLRSSLDVGATPAQLVEGIRAYLKADS